MKEGIMNKFKKITISLKEEGTKLKSNEKLYK
jgi:hypothetical protein